MARGRGSPTGIMARGSSIGGSLLRSVPKGMICMSAMGTGAEESFLLLEKNTLMGWLWRQAGARLYRGVQLAAGVKIYPYEVS